MSSFIWCGVLRGVVRCEATRGSLRSAAGAEHDPREYPANLHQKKTTALAVVFLLSEVGLGEKRRSNTSISGLHLQPVLTQSGKTQEMRGVTRRLAAEYPAPRYAAVRYGAPQARSTTQGSIPLISTSEKEHPLGCPLSFCC